MTPGKLLGMIGRWKKIVLIDDNDRDRGLLCDVLEAEGYEVAEAGEGAEGLRALFASRPGNWLG